MKEKRISLRFRTDNEQDMRAWDVLERIAGEKNASKNSVAIELILSALKQEDSTDALAERIAELVATKIASMPIQREATEGDGSGTIESVRSMPETELEADEPKVLGEDALDFLDMFG